MTAAAILAGCNEGSQEGLAPSRLVAVTIAPERIWLAPGETAQFGTSGVLENGDGTTVTVSYSATGGTITGAGLYTAGPAVGSHRVVATEAGGSLADTAEVTISTAPPPTLTAVEVTPSAAAVAAGTSQAFLAEGVWSDGSRAEVAATWTASGGTVTAMGVYTAGATAGAYRVIGGYQGLADTADVTVTGTGTITILSEDFEGNPNLNSLFDDRGNAQNHRVVTDPALAYSGSGSLEILYPAGGSGGWLTKFFMPGYQTSATISVRVRLDPNWQGATRLLGLQGSHVDDPWSATGVAGVCPEVGKAPGFLQFFTSVVQQSPTENGALRYYNQFLGMPAAPGNCWSITGEGGGFGTASFTPRNFFLTPGQWHLLEMEVVLNAPGTADGSHRFWVDGTLRGEWTAIRWRDTPDVRLNSMTLMVHSTSPQAQRLWFDDLVVTVVP